MTGVRRKPSTLERVTAKHERVIACLVYGDHHGNPLSINEICQTLRLRKSYVRDLLRDPRFKAEMAAHRDSLRAFVQPEAINKLISIMRTDGEGSPADRRLQMDAAKTILGDDAKAPLVNVGVQVNNETRPGYVLRTIGVEEHKDRVDGED